MPFSMICISKHNIMLLGTLLLQIYSNYVPYGMNEIGDCLYVVILTLLYHSSYPSLYVNFNRVGEHRIQTYLSSDFFPQ